MAQKLSKAEVIALVEERLESSKKVIRDELTLLREIRELDVSSVKQTLRVVEREASLLRHLSFKYKNEADLAAGFSHVLRAYHGRIVNKRAPVSRLPNDLLIEVIRWAAFQENTSPHELVSFTSTCCHWREVLLSAPSLWTTITYCDSRKEGRSPFNEQRLEVFSTFLQRSKTELLDVSIIIYAATMEQGERLLALLVPHMTRCKSIHFDGLLERLSIFLPINQSPSLLHLRVSSELANYLPSNRPLTLLAPEAGCTLRTLGCSLYQLDVAGIDGSQITSLELADPTAEMFAFAGRCARLERLTINFRTQPRSAPGISPQFRAPSLRALTIHSRPYEHALVMVIADNLLHLILHDHGLTCNHIDKSCWAPELSAPFPSLRSMKIHKYIGSHLEFDSITRTHPNLTGIHLSFLFGFFRAHAPLLPQFLEPWNREFQKGDRRRRYLRIYASDGKVLSAEEVLPPLIALLEEIAPLYLQVITLSGDLGSVTIPEQFQARVEVAKDFPQSIAEVADWVNDFDIMAS